MTVTDYQLWEKKQMKVNVAHVIRGYMAGYAGGASFAREMAQNADDAQSKLLRFNFEPDRLVVSNDSVFSERDFEAIKEIAAGSKRDIQDNIGTWGTGFLSVYQLTDHPEVCSAGQHLIFDPKDATYKKGISNVVGHTEFHFPWRKYKTEISRELEADIWDTARITKFQQDLSLEIYRLLPFLRCVNTIAVYQGSSQILYKITRTRQSSEQLANSTTFERWVFNYEQAGEKPKKDDWLFYRASLPAPYMEDNRKIKDPTVAIGLCLKQSGSGGELPGTLYNFLPTDIDTGFRFHFNGDFFPDSNRKSILKGDGSNKSKWNERVLATIGWLFAHNLEYLRDQCASPAAFYRLLPISRNPRHDFLQPIVDNFIGKAANTPIIKTTDEHWNMPRAVKLVENSRLFSLSQAYLPNIAPRTNSAIFPEEMTKLCQQLGAQPLKVGEYLAFLQATLRDGKLLTEQPEPANSREKLYAIFDYFKDLSLDERAEMLQNLDKVPLFLDETGCVQAFGKTSNWLADKETREILPRPMSGIADQEFQNRFLRLVGEKVQSFGPREMVLTLRKVAGNSSGKYLVEAHPMVNSRPKLAKIYDYLIKREVFGLGEGPKSPTGAYSNPINLKGLPLVVTTNHQIRLIGNEVFLADSETRQLLAPTNPVFVSPEINEDSRYRQFLYKAGVPEMNPAYLIELLKVACGEGQKHPLLDSIDKLKLLYTYFKRRNDLLSPQNRLELQQLPFILTKQGQLAPAIGKDELNLPPPVYTPELQKALEILKGDYLVNEKLLTPELRPFFTNTLQMTELSMLNYLGKHVATQYERVASSEQRLVLLGFIRDQLRLLQSPEGKEALAALARTKLIMCHDGEYRRPTEVYFPATLLVDVFPHGYNKPDISYNIFTETGEKSTDKIQNRGPESSPWYSLFDHLGMSKRPTAADLVSSINRSVAHPPSEQSVKHIDTVYRLININWVGDFELEKADFEPLRNLRWLPAEGDNTRWYAPQQLYWASLRYLIESQVKILPFGQNRREFSDFLGLNVTAKLPDVVSHLLYLSKFQKVESNIRRIYLYLKDFADDSEISRLKNKPVIYDANRNHYWSPEKVFLGDYSEDFGPYRGYLTGDEVGEYAKLFTRIGVRTQPESPKDYRELLEEIANQYQAKELETESERCLNRAYLRLAEVVDSFTAEELKRLTTLPLIIDKQTNQLTLPANCFIADRTDLYEKFQGQEKVRLAKFADQRARPFLLKLGVRDLSAAVVRRQINVGGGVENDGKTTTHLRALVPHLKRLVDHYRLSQANQNWSDLALLKEVEVKFVSRLDIQYVIEGGNEPILGAINSEAAFYNEKEKNLYTSDRLEGRTLNRAIAFELARIMNPSQDATILAPLLTELLSSNIGEAEKILNDYHIKGTGATGQKFETPKDLGQGGIQLGKMDGEESKTELPKWPLLPARPSKTPDNGKTDSADSVVKPEPNKKDEGARGQSSDKPTPPPPPPPDQPEPQSECTHSKPEAVPPFAGKNPTGPRNFTDYYDLAKRYGAKGQDSGKLIEELKRQDKAEHAQTPNQLPLWEDEEEPAKNERVDKVRFVLSFMNRYEGYLPLKKRAVALLAGQPNQIRCQIDGGYEFPLYIDRERGIIYNQTELPAFFASHTIPAGGVVYLSLAHANLFRLYFKSQPHTVQGVKLAEIGDDGKLEYTVVDMEVPCETEDCVFITEKRFEELPALFLEARGKKSVFETVIDIFEVAITQGKKQLHQNEIFTLVFNIRMISHATVSYELNRHACFVNKGEDYWSFDPTRVMESFNNIRPTPPAGPKDGSKPTNPPTGQEGNNSPGKTETPRPPVSPATEDVPAFLSQYLDRVLDKLQRLAEDEKRATLRRFLDNYTNFKKTLDKLYRELEHPNQSAIPLHGSAEMVKYYLSQLNHHPDDPELQSQLENALEQLFNEALAKDLLLTPELEILLGEAEVHTLRIGLKPYFAKLSGRLAQKSDYAKAVQIWKIYHDFDPEDDIQAEFAKLENKNKAVENYQLCIENGVAPASEKLELLREALQLDPDYKAARQLYDSLLVEAIQPIKENIRQSLSGFKLKEALQHYAELQSLVKLNISFAYRSDSLQNDLVRAAIVLLDFIGDAHNSGLGNKEQYLAVAQLYFTLNPNTDHWRRHKTTYFKSMARLGEWHLNQSQPVQAAIFYARAVQFFDEFRLSGNMADEGQKLAEIYEALGLWDWSYKVRTKLLNSGQLSPKEIPVMRNLLQRADMERNSLSVSLEHDKFALELEKCQQDKELITAVGHTHLNKMVTDNQLLL